MLFLLPGLWIVLVLLPTQGFFLTEKLYETTRCFPLSRSSVCQQYERCKATSRCGRADEDYLIQTATTHAYDRKFAGGNRTRIALMNDFEDWKAGTHHWKAKGGEIDVKALALGFNSFDFHLLGVLELTSGNLLFDTSAGTISGDFNMNGVIANTSTKTEAAVFNFESIYLGKDVKVRFRGIRALVILCRSSAIIDTTFEIPPGKLGGFPGGGYPAENNKNGPGSANSRVYVKTVRTLGTDVDEIQQIQTSVRAGQNLGGTFIVHYKTNSTLAMPFDIETAELERHMETALSGIGEINVEEFGATNPRIGRTWRITFLTAVGDVPQLQVTSRLTGIESRVTASTLTQGNSISGNFRLQFLNAITRDIPHDASAELMRTIIVEDLPGILSATVSRTDPLNRCFQGSTIEAPPLVSGSSPYGDWVVPNQRRTRVSYANEQNELCESGRGAAGGLVWKIEMVTRLGNVVPLSPSSAAASQTTTKEPLVALTVKDNVQTLLGVGARVDVQNALCLSLAFGGGGGSYGGSGGNGYIATGSLGEYNSQKLTDLLGGSGGSGGGRNPLDVLPFVRPILGGHGGGALLISTVNDLTLGENAVISVNGATGENGMEAGGGGSGGTILLASNASIVHMGKLSVLGGDGGKCDKSSPGASSGGGGSGGRIALYAESFMASKTSVIEHHGGKAQDHYGGNGSVYIDTRIGLSVRVDPSSGAAGTSKSLLVVGSEPYISSANQMDHIPISMNGPQYHFDAIPSIQTPTRASWFVKIGAIENGGVLNAIGGIFGLHDPNTLDEIVIGVGIVDGCFSHEANFYDYPRHCFYDKVKLHRWYKLDIYIQWQTHTYTVHLNDVEMVYEAKFSGDSVRAVGLYNYHYMATWWDEIYVGIDYTLRFRCPEAHGHRLQVLQRKRKLWPEAAVGQETTYAEEVRHLNHLSSRKVYANSDGNFVPFDGPPHKRYVNDIASDPNDVHDANVETLGSGEMLDVQSHQDNSIIDPLETSSDKISLTTAANGPSFNSVDLNQKKDKRWSYYWYSEVYEGPSKGGIGACSTTDYITWRNEGIMLYFENLTDPFGDTLNESLIAERPKVLLNPKSTDFVMWLHIDTRENDMGLTGVASSEYPNGPFTLHRSFYPDAPLEAPGGVAINETHDQTIFSQPDGTAYLIRTYYKTVNYWLPSPVMDNLWESVKNKDGSTDPAMTYHRAFFHEGYDDVDDIYLQRWRTEDQPWRILCCNPDGTCDEHRELPVQGHQFVCKRDQKKRIIGQGVIPIKTRYKDPNNYQNNVFRATAVPSHTTWGSQVYNIKTWRGNYYDALSTNISQFVFQRYAGQRTREEIDANGTEYQYPNVYELDTFINTSHTDVLDSMLDTLGVPISNAMRQKYSMFDLRQFDSNIDGKLTADEAASLETNKILKKSLARELHADYLGLRDQAVKDLDVNMDKKITFGEFEAWISLDPDLTFDRFDLDKSGYLDENELARLLMDRLVPRIDTVMILLDPDFDGRVYYSRFEKWLYKAPDFIFHKYDFDSSGSLNKPERDQLHSDIGPNFLTSKENLASFNALINKTNDELYREDYDKWFSSATSLIRGARNAIRADNAIHATQPDKLTGPLQVVETRRAKYVGISRLSPDYLKTMGLLTEVEGDFEGHDALINVLSFSANLFNLQSDSTAEEHIPFRRFLSPQDLGHRSTFWNGYTREGRPAFPVVFTYASECRNTIGRSAGCPECLNHSPHVTERVKDYQTERSSYKHCNPNDIVDAYIKAFDQQVTVQLRYQQTSRSGNQGYQPHYSPCVNQSQSVPCDVHKVLEGGAGRAVDVDATAWNLAWERHPGNKQSSQKIRSSPMQALSYGMSYEERFPKRERAPKENINSMLHPDQMDETMGGG